jgi:tetratricopeptide (TPR) repeat protein
VISSGFRDARIKQAISLVESRQYEAAIVLLKSIISADKESEFPKRALGVCYIKTGQLLLAEKIFIEIFKKNRASFDAANNLGVIYNGRQDFLNAKKWFQIAVDLNPNDVLARYNLANAQMSLLDYQSAEQEFQKCLSINRNAKPVLKNLGGLYLKIDQHSQAIKVFKRLLELDPNDAASHNSLAIAHSATDENQMAKSEYEEALRLIPNNLEYLVNFAGFLKDLGLAEEALLYAKRAEEINSDDKRVNKALASILRNLGNRKVATSYLMKLIEAYPEDYGLLRMLSVTAPESFSQEKIEEIKGLFSATEELDGRCQIGHTLFGIFESKKEYHAAFQYLKFGNDAEKARRGYAFENDVSYFEKLREMNRRLDLIDDFSSDSSAPVPIFIIGMPRSGTSILEQILSASGECAGLGELSYAKKFVEREMLNRPKELEATTLYGLRSYYFTRVLDLMAVRQEKTPYFVDKMPHNFRFVVALATAIPEAKFIHLYRDPAATCWSNYSRFFPADGLSYSFDLQDVANYYGLYRDYMTEISAAKVGGRLYHLEYERLTDDLRGSTESLMSYLGLGWQEEMLTPHLNSRSVRTASSLQVKKPVYKGSSEAWKNYEAEIGVNLRAVQPFEAEYSR